MLQSDWIHFVFLNRIFWIGSAFRHIGSAFCMIGMGDADWVESHLPKTALAVACCSFLLKPVDTTEGELQESTSKFYYPTKL